MFHRLFVMFWVEGGEGLFWGRCVHWTYSMGLCGSLEMDVQHLLSRLGCFFGRGHCVSICGDDFVCTRCVCIFIFQVSYEPLEFGGISFVLDGTEKLFPCCLLFVLDIIPYLFCLLFVPC